MKPYTRRVNYYETDRMQIVHHTNYIRYFEEARMDFMKQIGCDVKTMESMGLIIPNVDAYAKYIVSLKFDDVFRVYVKAAKFTGVRIKFEYEIRFGEKNTLSCEGYTTHCFVNHDYKPVSVKHSHPDIYNKLFETAKN